MSGSTLFRQWRDQASYNAGEMSALAELLGESPGIRAVREQVGRLLQRQSDARRLAPILIQGETGTGKGVLARAIHRAGPRAAGPFVDVNCAAIPETLLEAELFGFERGAFTDAKHAKAGLFQAANRGTLFLDEVGLLPEALQAKLLTVLEERAVRRLGSTRSEPVDVWILAASNNDLATAVHQRRFREDLYHRLAVLTLRLPPLRERGEDIVLLAEHFLAHACADYGLSPKTFAPDARAALVAYPWPGNVRELANVIERVALLSETSWVAAEDLDLPEARVGEPRGTRRPESGTRMIGAGGAGDRDHFLEVLSETNWNLSRAAARLGIPRNTLRYRIEKLGLRREESEPSPERRPAGVGASMARAPSAPAGPSPAPTTLRWGPRRLTLLRAVLSGPAGTDSPPEASRALQVLIEKVQSFGGRIEEAGPKGVLAVFGLEPVEDAPNRAALAAMAIQKAVERARNEGEAPAVRIGIHTGRFMVGHVNRTPTIDLDDKRQGAAILESMIERAEPNAIWVSEEAARFLERRFELISSAGQGARLAGREPTGVGARGRIARFVGRDDELQLLRSRLGAAQRGYGQVVGIGGEAGIGKSRLLYEFRQGLGQGEITYLEGRCVSYGSNVPYLPVLDLLHQQCGISEADPADAIAEKVHAALQGLGMDPAETAPYLLYLLGVEHGTESVSRLSPEVIKARTFQALQQVSLASSRQRPLILAIEDLHWIDTISEEYLVSLVEGLAGAAVLLLVTYRSGYRAGWLDKSYATQIALQALSPEDSRLVVRSVGEALPEPVTGMIVERAEGNPFFLEELAWAAGEHEDLTIPETVQAVLLARIDRLRPEDKALLQTAAAIGRDVPFALLQVVGELSDEALRPGLSRLQASEFLHEMRAIPDLEYTFKHALTHDVAYESLLPDRRKALHARIVEAIEQRHADRLADQVERLAHHALRGEMWEKALAYCRQAGAKAFARSANREAVASFEQALAALAHLPWSRELLEQAVDLRLDLRQALLPLGEFGRMLDELVEARALAETLGDERRLGLVSAYLSFSFRQTGDYQQALESGQRALAIAARLGDLALQVTANYYLGQHYYVLGEYGRAIGFFRDNVESLHGDRVRKRFGMAGLPSVFNRAWLAWSLAELGQFAEGIACGEQGIRIAEAADHPFSLAQACGGVGTLSLVKGDLHRAVPVLERGLSLCQVLPFWFPWIASPLGAAYALSGRLAEALPLLEQAAERAAAMRNTDIRSLRLALLSEGYLLAGRIQEAATVAKRALDLARQDKQRGCEAWALRLLGEIALHSDPPDVENAEASYRRALTLAEELGMRPLAAHCHVGLGTLYRRIGKLDQARSELSLAIDLYRSMEMTFWLEKAEAQRG